MNFEIEPSYGMGVKKIRVVYFKFFKIPFPRFPLASAS